jgi:hypothetical protein
MFGAIAVYAACAAMMFIALDLAWHYGTGRGPWTHRAPYKVVLLGALLWPASVLWIAIRLIMGKGRL